MLQRTPTPDADHDDNGTPGDGSDDSISGTWSLGAAARNVTTGSGDFALERWTSITHTMDATPDSATPNADGGLPVIGWKAADAKVPVRIPSSLLKTPISARAR
jgi:hypothetical protein